VYLRNNEWLHVSDSITKANILINKDRRACIADFGLTTITGVGTHSITGMSPVSTISDDTLMSFTAGGTQRWMSPELLDPERFGIPQVEENRPTRQSDCYALGMVIYEVSVHVDRFDFDFAAID
jgi:serine/threonine protein kinase